MKKLLVLVSLMFVSVLVFAQSPGDRMITSEAFKQYINTKQLTDTLQKAVEKAKLEQLKKQKEQEERMLKIKKEAEPICSEIVKDKENKEDKKFVCILKAIFLGGKFPWETDEEYRFRLEMSTWPASQPSK